MRRYGSRREDNQIGRVGGLPEVVHGEKSSRARAKRLAIEESDLQDVMPGAKAYWNARGLPSTLSGSCCEDFFVDGRRYSCEMRWGHIGDEHAAKATKHGANGDAVEVWVYGKSTPKRSADR